MKLHPEELARSRQYTGALSFERLSDAQVASIQACGRRLYAWTTSHPKLHNTINVLVIVCLFVADYVALIRLPGWLLPDAGASPTDTIWVAALSGSLHSYLLYSMGIFSLHEGYTHRVLILQIGPISRWLHRATSQLCRLTGPDPQFYAANHIAHHHRFGTEDDGELLNFVRPRRYWMTWLPLATIYADFNSHRPPRYTNSRVLTAVATLAFNGAYGYFVYRRFGWLFMIVSIVIAYPHVGFYLDRARQFTEHNLMPLENRNGARSFGWGFWGMLLGGGPWGTPCHLEHHLVPHLAWYQQLVLHAHFKSVLTSRQRAQFLVQPVFGWPRLWWHILREHGRLERQARQQEPAGV